MSFSCQGLERVAKVLTVLTIAKMELFTSIAFRDLCSAKRHNENMAELDPATWMVLLRQPQEEPHRFPVSSWKCLLSHTTWHEWALSPVTHVWDLIELLDSGFRIQTLRHCRNLRSKPLVGAPYFFLLPLQIKTKSLINFICLTGRVIEWSSIS